MLAFQPSGYTAPEARSGWWDWQNSRGKKAWAVPENSDVFFFPAPIHCFFRNLGVRCLNIFLTQVQTWCTCTVLVEKTQ